MMEGAPPAGLTQLAILTRTFFGRFFETELTASSDDPRGTFLWMLGALATPGLFLPWLRVFDWQMLAAAGGAQGLRDFAAGDKVFYLTFTTVFSGALMAVTWTTTIPDRRDAWVIDPLPVAPATVVAARLLALGLYILTIAVFAHTGASVLYGTFLSTGAPATFLMRGIAAHFLASVATSMSVCFVIIAAQATVRLVAGPRAAYPLLSLLQAALVIGIAMCVFFTPAIVSGAGAIARQGATPAPWLYWIPPVWFLGLYEQLLGNAPAAFDTASRRALLMFAAGTVGTAIIHPLAYYRVRHDSLTPALVRRPRLSASWISTVARWTAPSRPVEGIVDFWLTATVRVERQRFVLVAAFGLILGWMAAAHGTQSDGAVGILTLGLPFAASLWMLAALRVTATLPVDMRASWLFDALVIPPSEARAAIERVMLTVGALFPALAAFGVLWHLHGLGAACVHGLTVAGVGTLMTQILLWNWIGVPAARPLDALGFAVARRSPLYCGAFLAVVIAVPWLETLAFQSSWAGILLVTTVWIAALTARYVAIRQTPVESDYVDPVAGLLNLH